MKQCIMIIVCLIFMGTGTVMATDGYLLQRVEQRTIMPYPTTSVPTVPVTTQPVEKMPFIQNEARPHFIPFIRLSPNPNGRGLGTEFGLNFGLFRSHGLNFGLDLF